MNYSPSKPKNKNFAIILALIGAVSSFPLAGIHKFYLGQPLWGVIYLIIGWQNPMARIACAIDIVIYLTQDPELFINNFNNNVLDNKNQTVISPKHISEVATAIRELEKLRQEGLISEYEFEEKRRQLLGN